MAATVNERENCDGDDRENFTNKMNSRVVSNSLTDLDSMSM